MRLGHLSYDFGFDNSLFTASLWVLASAFLGMLLIARMYWRTPKGMYDLCFGCHKKLSHLRRIISAAPFCCRDCKDSYDARFRTEAISRLWKNTTGAVIVEDALLYAAALGVSAGVYRYLHHALYLIVLHVVNYAGCSAPPGACQ